LGALQRFACKRFARLAAHNAVLLGRSSDIALRWMPATVVSTTLEGPLDRPDATLVPSKVRPTHLRESSSLVLVVIELPPGCRKNVDVG
jgi:hypothetical protein